MNFVLIFLITIFSLSLFFYGRSKTKSISIETRSRGRASGFSFKPPKKKILRLVQKLLSKFVFNKRGVGMIALQKIAEDNRNWNWHNEFF